MIDPSMLVTSTGDPVSTAVSPPAPCDVAGRTGERVGGGTGDGASLRGRRWVRRDAGQASAEFLGMLVCVALVVGALTGPSEIYGYHVSRGIRAAICRILGQGCTQEYEEHAPDAECTVNDHSVGISAEIVIASISLGGGVDLVESKTYDKDGRAHYYVNMSGTLKGGVEFSLGEEVKAGDVGEGLSADVKAGLSATGGEKFEFDTKGEADYFMRAAEDEPYKQAFTGWDPTGFLHWLADKISGTHFDPPPPTEVWIEGGASVTAEAGATEGVASGTVSAGISGVIGVKEDTKTNDKTLYVKVSAEAAAKLGLLETAEAEAKASGEVVLGITYDKDGKPTKASLAASGSLNASLGLTGPLASTLTGGAKVGGGVKGAIGLDVDLTKGDNLNVVADAMHSLAIPVLLNAGTGAKDPVTAIGDVYKLFDSGAEGAVATMTTSTSTSSDFTLGGKFGVGLTFGAEFSHKTGDSQTTSGKYYLPGQGWVTWEACY